MKLKIVTLTIIGMIAIPVWGMEREQPEVNNIPQEELFIAEEQQIPPEGRVWEAIDTHNLSALREALNQNPRPNLAEQDGQGYTPLLWVIGEQLDDNNVQQEMVEALIRAGADINQACVVSWDNPLSMGERTNEYSELIDGDGKVVGGLTTPLIEAIGLGEENLVELLLSIKNAQGKRAADVNARGVRGEAALHKVFSLLAYLQCLPPVNKSPVGSQLVTWLLDAGADINAQDASGNTPLHMAVATAGQIVRIAISRENADINGIRNDIMKAIKILLARGVDFTLKDNEGRTPYDLAKYLHLGNKLLGEDPLVLEILRQIGQLLAQYQKPYLGKHVAKGWHGLEQKLPHEVVRENIKTFFVPPALDTMLTSSQETFMTSTQQNTALPSRRGVSAEVLAQQAEEGRRAYEQSLRAAMQ